MEQRKIGWRTFNWYPINYYGDGKDTSLFYLRLGNLTGISNMQLLNEFVNACSNLYYSAHDQYLPELEKELLLAKDMIYLIKKEYHLKDE